MAPRRTPNPSSKVEQAIPPAAMSMSRAPTGYEKWDKHQLANYIAKETGLGEDCKATFVQNSVTGKTAPRITEAHLREMGFTSIGDRQEILQALNGLREASRQQKREVLIWEGEEFLFHSWWSECKHTCCGLCPAHPKKYKLFGAHLSVLKEEESMFLCIPCPCCGTDRHTDNVDLTYVTDVDSGHVKTPCCENTFCCGVSADWVNVKSKSAFLALKLEKGQGEIAARTIKNQVEEHQVAVRGENPHV